MWRRWTADKDLRGSIDWLGLNLTAGVSALRSFVTVLLVMMTVYMMEAWIIIATTNFLTDDNIRRTVSMTRADIDGNPSHDNQPIGTSASGPDATKGEVYLRKTVLTILLVLTISFKIVITCWR
jgi:hypothetical protein